MDDLKDALEARRRTYEPRPGGFERLVRRRRNRDVRRRVGAGTLAAAIALLAIWGVQTAFRSRPQQIPSIMPTNVASLRQVWSAQVPGTPSAPVIAGDLSFVVADKLYAFPVSCPGSGSCAPAWTGDVGGPSSLTPSVGDGVVVTTSSTRLSAFSVSCVASSGTCEPLWTALAPGPGTTTHAWSFSSAVVRAGWVYATASNGLHVFPLRCGSNGGPCRESWFAHGYGSPVPPVVADDMVIVFAHPLTMAFPATCPRPSCPPLWKGVVPLNSDHDQSGVAIDGDELIIGPSVFLRTRGLPQTPRWIAGLDSPTPTDSSDATNGATVAGGRVYLASDRVYVFPSHCATGGELCPALWKGVLQPDPLIHQRPWSAPVVVNGLVFSATDRPYAYGLDCGTGGATCAPLWVGPAHAFTAPGMSVSGSHVVVTYSDGTIADFEPSTA